MNYKKLLTLSLLLFAHSISFSQSENKALRFRAGSPEIKIPRKIFAPGYCESSGGSTAYERIDKISVVEKAGNLLDITVEVYIANPSNCVSGQPCSSYDNSPEYVNVWIDWNGNKQWEAHEKVLNAALTGYQSINYGGTMTAKATVEIPPNAVKPAWLRANLGYGYDPDDPCVLFWSWGNVVDQQVLWNMKVKEISATLNVEISDVPAPLWKSDYSESGEVINTVSNSPVAAGMKNGWFTMPVTLVSFPEALGINSSTDCNWEITGTGINGSSGINGKTGVVKITLPQKIGFYDLKLNFMFKNSQGNPLGEQTITIPLWVSYDRAQLPSIKKKWLEKAIEWTDDTQLTGGIEDVLAEKIMNGIYLKSGWKYFQYNFLWSKLIDGQETVGGNCHVVANVWLNLLKTLGVGGVSTVTHSGKSHSNGFMVKPGFRAFGNLQSQLGNASPDYLIFPTFDRWVFDGHTYGQKGTTFYDPTFNAIGFEKFFHVAYDIVEVKDGVKYTETGGPSLHANGVFGEEGGTWPKYIYKLVTLKNQSYPSKLAGGAVFTGTFSGSGIDSDNDGIYNQLSSTVGIEIQTPGKYVVNGVLKKNNQVITSRPCFTSPSAWFESIGPQTGVIQIQSLFSGEAIFTNGQNGPFTVQLYILDSTGTVTDIDSFTTSSYNYTEFGETPVRISSITESASDTTGDGSYDLLSTDFTINATIAGNYSMQVTLSGGGQLITSGNKTVTLSKGINQVSYSINGSLISVSGLNGLYTLSLQVLDINGEQAAYREITTKGYAAAQFSLPPAWLTGGTNDSGNDTDSNGLFDYLDVSVIFQSQVSDTFTVTAWLMSSNDVVITWTELKVALQTGATTVILKFPGVDINRSQYNGTYKIGYAVITNSSSDRIYSRFNLYTTKSYNAAQFETPKGLLVTSTGIYSESIIDHNANLLIDSLVIEIGVIAKDSGNVVALGRLVDSEDETILWASTIEFAQKNISKNLHLKFDGRYIYGSLQDGPYRLKDLQIYHVGEPGQIVEIPNAYTTSAYEYTDFEKTNVVSGIISDAANSPVKNAFLIVNNNDNDYSSVSGKYNLVLLNDGDFDVKIEGPDSLDLDWSISLNGNLVATDDSIRISVSNKALVNLDFKAPVIITGIKEPTQDSKIISDYFLRQNYPNPFNPETNFIFNITMPGKVSLKIYDVLGNEITILINKELPAGEYRMLFNTSRFNLPSGVYYYKLESGSYSETRKMVLLK